MPSSKDPGVFTFPKWELGYWGSQLLTQPHVVSGASSLSRSESAHSQHPTLDFPSRVTVTLSCPLLSWEGFGG